VRVAFGLKPHSGWAALVVLGGRGGDLEVVDRRRLELVDEAWAKAPYHAAEELAPEAARERVERGIEAAHRVARRELRAALDGETARGNQVHACAVLTAAPMPGWSVAQILAVHFRMHKAEGVLFREALAGATEACGAKLVAIEEKALASHAEAALGTPAKQLAATIAVLGKSVGPPWGRDQKDAALAALVALRGNGARRG
jgi:hypothetical protein